MVKVRSIQVEAFRESADQAYLESAADHLERYHPVLAASAGRENLRAAARRALDSASSYSLTDGGGLQLYLELMADFGSAFDQDPAYFWLHPFLQRQDGMSGRERSRLIHFHATAYLERAHGPHDEFAQSALERTIDRLPRFITGDTLAPERVNELVAWLHPEREPFLAPGCGAEFLANAQACAAQGRLPQAVNLILVLQFHLGSGMSRDPLYPWVRAALESEAQPRERFKLLYESAKLHFAALRGSLDQTKEGGSD